MTAISIDDTSSQTEEVLTSKFLSFQVKDEIYGLEITHIKEIMEYGKVTRIPLMPNYIRGLINLRGGVLPIIDLAEILGKGKTHISRRSCSLIVDVYFEGELYKFYIFTVGAKAQFSQTT